MQLSGSTRSEKQQVKTRLEINVCKSYTEQIKHKNVKELSGKSLDTKQVFLKWKILPSCICMASGHLPTPTHFENANPNIVKHCEKSYTLLKIKLENWNINGQNLHLISSIMLTYSSSGFGHWPRQDTARTKQNCSFSLEVLTCLDSLCSLFPWIENFPNFYFFQLRKRKFNNF